MVLWFFFCDLCKHVVVSGKLGMLREEKREVGDQPGILSLKDGPFGQRAGPQLPLGRRQDAEAHRLCTLLEPKDCL